MAFDTTQLVETIRQGACEHLASIVLDQEAFRQSLLHMDVPSLSGNFTTLMALLGILSAQPPGSADLALPVLSKLAGFCQIEAARRGYILHQGEKRAGDLVARLVAENMLGYRLPEERPGNPAWN